MSALSRRMHNGALFISLDSQKSALFLWMINRELFIVGCAIERSLSLDVQ